ncbi:MAG: ABC transporter ATP-binding protein [Verrucomicrobiota bacterium]
MSEAPPKSKDPAKDKGEPIVEVKDLVRKFGDRTVLNGISFKIYRGDTLIIMGGSGCGKSTLLRHVIGSLKPTSGSVKLFGQEITDMNEFELNKMRKRFGMNFQFGALMQSLTVGQNVALPLMEHSDVDSSIIDLVVKMKLELVGLTGFEDLMPSEISGGMRKRVGLARAVALDPELLFSDEPTSGLDPVMTAVVDELTLQLTRNMGMTAMVVSHDMTSCFRIATHMLMLGTGDLQGKVVAYGTPEEIRNNPHPFLQQFIKGEPDGPIPLKLSKDAYIKRLVGEET